MVFHLPKASVRDLETGVEVERRNGDCSPPQLNVRLLKSVGYSDKAQHKLSLCLVCVALFIV